VHFSIKLNTFLLVVQHRPKGTDLQIGGKLPTAIMFTALGKNTVAGYSRMILVEDRQKIYKIDS